MLGSVAVGMAFGIICKLLPLNIGYRKKKIRKVLFYRKTFSKCEGPIQEGGSLPPAYSPTGFRHPR
jgi:hypothetical protein